MTPTTLSAFGAVVAAARAGCTDYSGITRRDGRVFLQIPMEKAAHIQSALAALPKADDPEAVEELAGWMYDRAQPGNSMDPVPESYFRLARALLAALGGGGEGEGTDERRRAR